MLINYIKKYLLTALFILAYSSLSARDVTITVLDIDLDLPLVGAQVLVQNGNQYICDRDGRAIVEVPDRQVIVQAAYPGYETGRIVVPAFGNSFTIYLRLAGILQGTELVIEGTRPGTSESRTGRSVALSEREIAQTSEIGIIEDVMNSVKLLPGVGYTGMFNGMPSIRGGDPGDLIASFDGFYLDNPYHWMGGISIFDPKMVSSASLSHGVFSARYGHTTSGLLEVSSKNPSPTEIEIETAIGTSAASLNLSVPFNGRGGILFMGKITYWETLVWAAQGLSRVIDNDTLDMINSVSTAPFIRSAALSMNYRFSNSASWHLNAFFGSDGVGAQFNTDYGQSATSEVSGIVETRADYGNYQTFLITGLSINPTQRLLLKITGGVGYQYTIADALMNNAVTVRYTDEFFDSLKTDDLNPLELLFFNSYILPLRGTTFTAPNINVNALMENSIFNAQLRFDLDFDLGKGFIAAFGFQELYNIWMQTVDASLEFMEFIPSKNMADLIPSFLYKIHDELTVIYPMGASVSDVTNHGLLSSVYGLFEYTCPNNRFGAELGLRVDHLFFANKQFNFVTMPAFNPRLNLDFTILKNVNFIDSLSLTAGTGLFSSVPSLLSYLDTSLFNITNTEDINVKLNRTWTSVIGIKLEFLNNYSFNIEGYYKYVFDRAYITARFYEGQTLLDVDIVPKFHFDGIGNVWGFDFQLQKLESRFIDGWISYTYTWAQYRNPSATENDLELGMGSGPVGDINNTAGKWYYPSFHRFHNANIVLNIKPTQRFNIGIRFGFASGQETVRATYGEPRPYPVLFIEEDEDGNQIFSIIQKYRRDRLTEEVTRTAWSLPLDLKFSFFSCSRNGKASLEMYFAVENLLSLFYNPTVDRTTLNEYTGRIEQQSSSANFDFPIPMISFGLKWRY